MLKLWKHKDINTDLASVQIFPGLAQASGNHKCKEALLQGIQYDCKEWKELLHVIIDGEII